MSSHPSRSDVRQVPVRGTEALAGVPVRGTSVSHTITDETGPKPVFVAIGIEHFLVGQGATDSEALADLERIVRATVFANATLRQPPLHGILPAPPAIQSLFATQQSRGGTQDLRNVADHVTLQPRRAA